jgi:anaerobic selenocysteine-containing dehydrogenase
MIRRLAAAEPADIDIASLIAGKIDYTKAKAVPTICFGCTTHCGVVGRGFGDRAAG